MRGLNRGAVRGRSVGENRDISEAKKADSVPNKEKAKVPCEPDIVKSANDKWERIYDNGSDAYYYQHKETFETTWETPQGFRGGSIVPLSRPISEKVLPE